MPTFGFTDFSDILPDPVNPMGQAGDFDPNAVAGGFASVRLSSVDSLMNTTVNSGRRTTTPASYHKWAIDLTYNPMTREEFQPIYAFLTFRRNIMKPFYLFLPNYNTQFNIDTTMFYDTPRGVPYAMVANTVGGTQPPQIFNIGLETKIYMVTRAETRTDYMSEFPQPPVGQERYHITPSLIKDTSQGTALDFETPKFYVQQTGNVSEYSLGDKNLYSFSLKMEEVLQ
jgi:hypothetical protein